jgi:hypothetical protein
MKRSLSDKKRISELKLKVAKVPKVTRKCHPEAQPKDLANEKEILRFAQNDSVAAGFAHVRHVNLERLR